MGMFNTYGSTQLKAGDCCALHYYDEGDKVDIEDGLYIGAWGFVVVKGGVFIAEYTELKDNRGDDCSEEYLSDAYKTMLEEKEAKDAQKDPS